MYKTAVCTLVNGALHTKINKYQIKVILYAE